jgi:hypothetical protein
MPGAADALTQCSWGKERTAGFHYAGSSTASRGAVRCGGRGPDRSNRRIATFPAGVRIALGTAAEYYTSSTL